MTSLKNKLAKSILWKYIKFLISSFNAVFITSIVARYFTLEEFGILSLSRSLVGIFSGFIGLGSRPIIIREIVQGKDTDHKSNILQSGLLVYIATALFSYIVLIILGLINNFENITFLLIISLLGINLFLKINDVFEAWYIAKINDQIIQKIKTFGVIFTALIKILFLYKKASIVWIAFSDVLGLILVTLLVIYFFKKENPNSLNSIFKFDWKKVKFLLKKGLPLTFSGLLIVLNLRIDTLLIGHLVGLKYVSIYTIGSRIPRLIPTWISAIEKTLLPVNIKASKNVKEMNCAIVKTYSFTFIITLIISLTLFCLAPIVIINLFGYKYQDSILIFRILLILSVLGTLSRSQSQYAIITGKTEVVLRKQIVILGTNLFFNLLLIPSYGVLGAAVATVVSFLIANIFYLIIDNDFRNIILEILFKPDITYFHKLIIRNKKFR